MNRRTIERRAKHGMRYELRRAFRGQRDINEAVIATLADHKNVLEKAAGRIDHHDEELGISRPIGSWKTP